MNKRGKDELVYFIIGLPILLSTYLWIKVGGLTENSSTITLGIIGIILSLLFVGIPLFIWFVIPILEYILEKQKQKEIKEKRRISKERKREKRKEFQKLKEEKEKQGLKYFEGKWVKKEELPRLKEIKIGLDKNFRNISSYEFEKFIAKLFRAMGYQTRVTQASNNYGIDVVAEKGNEKIAIQCKRYHQGNPVSNRDVQRLLGAMQLKSVKATHSIIITTSHFTVQAMEQAKECTIELWDKHELHKMVKKYLMEI